MNEEGTDAALHDAMSEKAKKTFTDPRSAFVARGGKHMSQIHYAAFKAGWRAALAAEREPRPLLQDIRDTDPNWVDPPLFGETPATEPPYSNRELDLIAESHQARSSAERPEAADDDRAWEASQKRRRELERSALPCAGELEEKRSATEAYAVGFSDGWNRCEAHAETQRSSHTAELNEQSEGEAPAQRSDLPEATLQDRYDRLARAGQFDQGDHPPAERSDLKDAALTDAQIDAALEASDWPLSMLSSAIHAKLRQFARAIKGEST